MVSAKSTGTLLFAVVCTVPLVYGARHPLVHGIYSSGLLLVCGSYLFLHYDKVKEHLRSFNLLHGIPLLLILYILCSSFSLPMPLLELITPERAQSLHAAKQIGGAVDQHTALAYYAPHARFYAIYFLALLLFYYALTPTLKSKTFLKKFLIAVTVIGTVEAVYGLLQSMNPDLGVLWTSAVNDQYRGVARGTIIYRNQYALFLNLCWPAAAALGLSLYRPLITKYASKLKRKRKMTFTRKISHFSDKAAIPLFCSALMMLAILFSQSRGGIIAMGITAIVFGLLLPVSGRVKVSSFGVILLFLCTYGMMIGGFDEISQRFSRFVAGAQGRFLIWADSLSMLKSHLLTGIGMGNYEFLSLVYLDNVPDKVWFDRAHNEYLELAIELGLVLSILLYIWMLVGVARYGRLIIKIRKAKAALQMFSTLDLAAIAAFSSLVAFMVHGFVDLVWRLPANMVYLVSLLAIMSAAARRDGDESR